MIDRAGRADPRGVPDGDLSDLPGLARAAELAAVRAVQARRERDAAGPAVRAAARTGDGTPRPAGSPPSSSSPSSLSSLSSLASLASTTRAGGYAVARRLRAQARNARSATRAASPAEGDLRATLQRVRTAAAVLLPDPSVCAALAVSDRPTTQLGALLSALVAACPERPGPAHWLVLTAAYGCFPDPAAVAAFARRRELSDLADVAGELLAPVLGLDPGQARAPDGSKVAVLDAGVRMRLVREPVVDVDFCARHETHTGIQRVVREVVPRWAAAHELVPVAHRTGSLGFRPLDPVETARVMAYAGPRPEADEPPAAPSAPAELVVPWQTVVVLPDVVEYRSIAALHALAEYSGNEVALVGYDMIPLVSSELRPVDEAGAFAHYLRVVKHAHRVAAISESAAQEFAGFRAMLPAQGLRGPDVQEIMLAEGLDVAPADLPGRADVERPVVVAFARREPHKNVAAVLQAAELLWAAGVDFELRLVGGGGWDHRALDRTIRRLLAEGRPLRQQGWVSEAELVRTLREATFCVYVSLHEGYGLPVAEALACGTPVVTADFGSQAEIAAGGGCVLVDVRDDAAIATAMRRLLEDPAAVAALRAEAAARTPRGWDDYAAQAWDHLVLGVGPQAAGEGDAHA